MRRMRRLTGVDNLFLKQEKSTQPQHTIKAVVLDPAAAQQPLTFEAIRAALPALVERIEPLRWQLLRSRLGRPWWIERPNIDLDHHVKRVSVPAPGGDRELSAQINEINMGGLDHSRPSWQLWYVDGLVDGRIALVLKLHHTLADGMASLRLLETMLSADPDEPLPGVTRSLTDERRPGAARWYGTLLRHQAAAAARFPNVLARSARTIQTVRARRKAGRPGFAEAFAAPSAPFNAPFTERREFAFVTCDLDQIKTVKTAFGVTVNDVYLAVCSGAVRSYLQRHGELAAESLSAVVPVAIRPRGAEVDWGNQVTTWYTSLATDIADPVRRLHQISANTKAARAVHDERDLWLFGDWMEYWPLFWFYGRALPILGAATKKRPTYSLIASNVPGPRGRLYFGGAPVEKLISVGPIVYPYGLNFTGWSYRDDMTIGMQACSDHIPDIWEIADGIQVALAELCSLAGESVAVGQAGTG
ncbi:diacylglycerol O-acyltransferase [Mycobacterium kiyosense]|uniref:Diacylglycerol O-acyltransferase n=2 Tax=Mycobacteriaceae TaxID=1762 RepID=A0A9P3QA82_9MYCO|nr:diacylglycerol O-acyltransferase [Mycobacterium kiyosense]BDE16518.1 diacylglycerol O-acyltransferase [Mycobacterium sp. 20KCMC460]GLB86672.1 diacylglycerol O-acyltransferase [Mycobacterium kiyosense]GLB89733.1 diacylglycerol O-acyltransferase [Mycobacterium kiyosense]GLB99229.1 diacylglycerol O-acyltransferase [Mycobacterium kiyosense]